MIDYEYNDYTPEPRKHEQPKCNSDETFEWLDEHCDFRPFGAEW